ncbi:MAG: Ppx/GppA phosphatase family protein [Balneolaceae bacterium]
MKAAIDIGTNTVLLLVAEIIDGSMLLRHEEQRTPRLGKGVDADGVINEAATQRVISALKEYKAFLEADFPNVDDTIVTATSAVRDAANRNEFQAQIKEETGFQVRLLSGIEEAEWTAAGALSMLKKEYKSDALILDIGGGSTEVALMEDGNLSGSHSFDMGSVRFTERFLKGNPPDLNEIEACRNEIEKQYSSYPINSAPKTNAVGVAGTVTTLAAITLNLNRYESSAINNYKITKESLEDAVKLFSTKSHEELLNMAPNVLKGREDIFLAGLLILDGFMSHYNFNHLIVSTGGIRHGAILKNKKKR